MVPVSLQAVVWMEVTMKDFSKFTGSAVSFST
jgi:hypothetical protein